MGVRTYLVNEDDTRNNLSDTLVNITFHDLVDFLPQLFGHLGPPTLHQASHHAHDVLPALWPRIRRVQVSESHVLHKFFPLVDVSLWEGDVRFRLKVV